MIDWIMIPCKEEELNILETLYNKKTQEGKVLVDNVFGILKKTFHELHEKIDVHVAVVLDLVTCCILHSMFLRCNEIDMYNNL